MAPSAAFKSREAEKERLLRRRTATEQYAQATHLVEGFADTLDALPPALTRSLSDLKELDAVLTSPLLSIRSSLIRLLDSLADPESMRPSDRLKLLREVVDEMVRYKVGGDDKIRVANGACESLQTHIRQLDVTASLLIASLPPSLESRIPDPTLPSGYPKLTGALRSKPSGGVWGDGLGFAGGSAGFVGAGTIDASGAFTGLPLGTHPDTVLGNALRVPGPAAGYGALLSDGMGMPPGGMPLPPTANARATAARMHDYPGPAPNKTGRASYPGHGIGPNGQAYALAADGSISDRKIHHNQHTKKRAREAEAAAMLGSSRPVGSSGMTAQQPVAGQGPMQGQRQVSAGYPGGTMQTFGMAPPPLMHQHPQSSTANGFGGGPGGMVGVPKQTNKRPRVSAAPYGDGPAGMDSPDPTASAGRGPAKKRVKKNDGNDASPRLMPSSGPPMNGFAGAGGQGQVGPGGQRRRSPLSTGGGSTAGSPALGHAVPPYGAGGSASGGPGTSAGGPQYGYAAHVQNAPPHRTVSGRQVNPPVRPGEELDGVPSWAITGSGQPPASYQNHAGGPGGAGNGNGRAGVGVAAGNGPKRGNSTASSRSRVRKLSSAAAAAAAAAAADTAEEEDDGDDPSSSGTPRLGDGTLGVPGSRARHRAGGRNHQAAAVAAAQKGIPFDEFVGDDDEDDDGGDGGQGEDGEGDGEGEGNSSRLYCVCQTTGGSEEPMVGCDNKNCPVEWFHLSCVGLSSVPEGSWYCDDCTARGQAGNSRRRGM